MEGYNLFKAGCYLVEVCDEAGLDGRPIMKDDLLAVDEIRLVGQADLLRAELNGVQRLYRTDRWGIPLGWSSIARMEDCEVMS